MTEVVLPNIRKLFRTDPGFIQFEADLKGADVWTVVYEAEDDELKRVLKSGIDLHAHNAEAMWGPKFTCLSPESHAYDEMRQGCKHTIHGIHFGCTPRTTAVQRGWLVSEAERFHNRWFSLHPGIRRFHDRVRNDLESTRTVTNKFGFRCVFFDRIDNCFTEALAWIPQSTTALCSYCGLLQLERRYWPHQLVRGWMPTSDRDKEGIILQTHDSGNFQFPLWSVPPVHEIKETLSVTVPYDDPMIIPWGLKQSTKSWGELEKCE
jgi:DNA polymerase family A